MHMGDGWSESWKKSLLKHPVTSSLHMESWPASEEASRLTFYTQHCKYFSWRKRLSWGLFKRTDPNVYSELVWANEKNMSSWIHQLKTKVKKPIWGDPPPIVTICLNALVYDGQVVHYVPFPLRRVRWLSRQQCRGLMVSGSDSKVLETMISSALPKLVCCLQAQ